MYGGRSRMGDQADCRLEPGTGVDIARRPPAFFVADALGLDFLNSIATPIDTPVDWIDDGEGLLDWLEQAQMVPADALTSIRGGALPGELDKVADQARSLREWFRGFVRQHMGRPLQAEALAQLEPLNRLLRRDAIFSRIVIRSERADAPFQLQMVRWWRTPDALLLPIGEALAQLICAGDFSKIKTCEGQPCTLYFADHTRGQARRWCSMAVCGNRAKQAKHRHRAKPHRV